MSLPARLLNVYAAPGEVFESVKAARGSVANWLVPALLAMVLGWVGLWLVFSQPAIQQQLSEMTNKQLDEQVAKGKIPEAAAERARTLAQASVKFSMYAGPPLAAFATPFWWGLILWLAGAKALKGGFGYMKAVEVAGLSAMIGVLDGIVRVMLILLTGNLYASLSPILLVKNFDPQNTAHALLGLVNVMLFWVLAVRAVGLSKLAGVSFARAAAWVFGIWAAYTGLITGFGLAMKAIFQR